MPVIEPKIIQEYHGYLMKHPNLKKYLIEQRGLTNDTITEFEIGYDPKASRYTIPVKNMINQYVNIRKYNPKSKAKMISYKEGYGEARLFPMYNLQDKPKNIIICEGEWDCLLLNQYGFPAVTNTCGVNSWNKEWNAYFIALNVAIIFDCDDAGRKAAKKLTKDIIDIVKDLKVVDLGLGGKEDITDWFVKHKKTPEELIEIIKNTEVEDLFELIDLSYSMDSKYYNKKIKFNGIVVGKDLSPFIVPEKVEAECTGDRSQKKCTLCPLGDSNFKTLIHIFNYEKNKELLVKMVNASDDQVTGYIKKIMGLPGSSICRNVKINILKRQNIEDVKMIPELEFNAFERIDKDYVIRKCLCMGVGIQTNQSYICKGTTLADPNTQAGIHLLKEVKSNRDNLGKFIMDEETIELLKNFQPEEITKKGIWEKLNDIYDDFTYNITRMYGRKEILMGLDLIYHSALYFRLNGVMMKKGWLEMTCIGDTKCGKTETIRNMVRHYKAGEFLTSGENTTRAGLIGGAQQTHNGRWTLTWGKLPLNDRGICIIDESDELRKNRTLDLLSGIRSSGTAELVKIQSQRTYARTRLIFIANPLNGKVNEYNYGVDTVRELWHNQQDISRVSLAVCVSREDVSRATILEEKNKTYPHKYTSDLCNKRIMFAWSRRPEQIYITPEAENKIDEYANIFGKKYSSAIPLIIDAEVNLKIAAMAVSLAIMTFSMDDKFDKVLVHASHVDVVADYISLVYDNTTMGYLDYSNKQKRNRQIIDPGKLDEYIFDNETIEMLLDAESLQIRDIEDIFECDFQAAKELCSKFRKQRAIKRKHTYYVKTPAFIKYLKQKKGDLL